MKKILITGENSYVGNSLEKWLSNYPDRYQVEKISLRRNNWKLKDFSAYDVIVHVAGIAHIQETKKNEELYYRVNRDLAYEVALKAKIDGVNQFIYLSSMSVYGVRNGVITKKTPLNPTTNYGKSKLQAEKLIGNLEDQSFRVAILRPPMIYGKGCKGNYVRLSNFAKKTPIFPNIENKRSMIYIENLCEFIKYLIDNNSRGLFFPQNKEYVNTSELVKLIAEVNGKNIKLTNKFNFLLKVLGLKNNLISKVFGNLAYDKDMSKYKENYQIKELKQSIIETERIYKPIDILLMSDNCLDTVGGEQESTKIIINGIKDSFSLGIIQPGKLSKKISGVDYYHLTFHTRIKHLVKYPFSFLGYILKIRKIIKNVNPKIIHTQAQISFFIVALLKKFNLISKNIKIIHTERGLYTKYSKFIKHLFYIFMKELDVLVTTTKFNMKYWKSAIQNRGLDLEYKIIENTAGELFETYDPRLEKVNTNKLVVGFAGRYCDWKNWPLAVDIVKKLNNKIGDRLHVKMAVGCLDKKAEKETKKMFGELKRVLGRRFSGKINIDIESMNKFYYEIDVFILTSKYNTESFGRTLVEAMSRKTIVLTTNSGGSVEVVGNMDNVCESANEFVDRILYLYQNKEIFEKEKEKNFKRVRQNYSYKNNIEKHLKLYSSILNLMY